MKKVRDFSYQECTADAVIDRGHCIFDEWKEKKLSSKKIVAYAERIASSAKANKGLAASMEALACIFAFELRIEERYSTLIRCIISYFSRRRELGAVQLLKRSICIADSNLDVRTMIEVELKRLRERLEGDKEEDGDDDTRGGKSNGKAEKEGEAAKEEARELTSEDAKQEKEADSEEAPEADEENPENSIEEKSDSKEEIEAVDDPEVAETREEVAEGEALEGEELSVEVQDGAKKESIDQPTNQASQKSEANINKFIDYAVDNRSIFESSVGELQSGKAESMHIIDELMFDDLAKRANAAENGSLRENIPQNKEAYSGMDSREATSNVKDNRKGELLREGAKPTELGDKAPAAENKTGTEATQREATEPERETQPQAQPQPNEPVNTVVENKRSESTRVQINVDMTYESYNKVAAEINNNMTEESALSYYNMLVDQAREQMDLADALGMDGPVEVSAKVDQPSVQKPTLSTKKQ